MRAGRLYGCLQGWMSQALRDYDATRPDQSVLMAGEDRFDGPSTRADRLAKSIQWTSGLPPNPATDQVKTQNAASSRLRARRVCSRTLSTKPSNVCGAPCTPIRGSRIAAFAVVSVSSQSFAICARESRNVPDSRSLPRADPYQLTTFHIL